MGDRMANLNKAINYLEQTIGPIQKKSSVYETAAWGNTNQPSFLNQAILLESSFNANQIMHLLLAIESKMGRVRTENMGPRTIDLDIIYFNNEVISNNLITIPHPKIFDRKFVLMPLVEIDPNFIHPVLNKSNTLLLKECGDSLAVYKKRDF